MCKLVKSLYGLKQALKQGHKKFNQVIVDYGFVISEFDRYVYFKMIGDNYVILCL